MNWFEKAEAQYQKYLDGEIDAYQWAEDATDLMEELLQMSEKLLDRLRNV